MVAREGKIGAAALEQRCERLRLAAVPGRRELLGEERKAAPGDLGDEGVAVAEVAIGCGGADPGGARQLGEAESRGPTHRDQLECDADQSLTEITVMVALAPPAAPMSRPAHVNG